MKRYALITCYFLLILATACNGDKNEKEETDSLTGHAAAAIKMEADPVKSILIRDTVFLGELETNGRLSAIRKINLKFHADGNINTVNVREGERISKGALVAAMDDQPFKLAIKQSELNLRQARLNYEDNLLRLGYRMADSSKIDIKMKAIASLRSGLSKAEIDMEEATGNLKKARLLAPFEGKIANLKGRAMSNSNTSDYLCTLLDDSQMQVDFLVMEKELPFFRAARTVKISTFNNDISLTGQLVSINPMVNENGMISIKALVQNNNRQLLDGMSVRISVQQALGKQLIVPKSAVLDRQGQKVVFTVKNNLAKWNYVEIAFENKEQYAIRSGLTDGDRVIYEGNFNLANDKEIKELR